MNVTLKKVQKVLNATNNFIYIFLCILFISCSTQKKIINESQIAVLNEVLHTSNNTIFYKTINKDLNKLVNDFITNDMEFKFCEKEIVFQPNEISFLRNKKLDIVNLRKLPLKFKEKITIKRKNIEASYISMPLIFRNNTRALYYTTEKYGGSFMLLNKEKSKWKILCSSQVWIE